MLFIKDWKSIKHDTLMVTYTYTHTLVCEQNNTSIHYSNASCVEECLMSEYGL